jgi:hypothetical protein
VNTADRHAARDRLAETYLQVSSMVRALSGPNPPTFMVVLSAYSIAGEEYQATALTISPTGSPNVVQTSHGFECDASFPLEQLSKQAVASCLSAADGLVTVRVTVPLRNIAAVLPLPG